MLCALILPSACQAPEGRPRFEVLHSRPPSRTLMREELWPLHTGEQAYLVVTGTAADTAIVRAQSPSDRFGAGWAVHEGDLRAQFYSVGEAGDIVLHAVIEHADRAISLFDPPLLSMPASLEPGVPQTAEAAMRVVHRDNPRRERERGRAEQTIEYAADCRIRIGEAEFDVARIELIFEADLRLADVRRVASMFIGPGRGLIAEESEQTTRILGIASTTENRLIVLAPPAATP